MKQLIYFIFFSFVLILSTWSCSTKPDFEIQPEIEFISFSKDTMEQNSLNTDSLFIKIGFKDGDGDLGSTPGETNDNIVIIDNRTDEIFDRYKIPEISEQGSQNGIEGEITIKLFTTCCIFPDAIPPCVNPVQYPENQINFSIYMVDDSGNVSDTIATPFITLLCN